MRTTEEAMVALEAERDEAMIFQAKQAEEIDRLRAENERLTICLAARDKLLAVKQLPSPEGISREEKLIWQLGNMMDGVENFYGAPNPKREGHIYSTAVRILDEVIANETEGK